jgi:hypothetical protein
MEPRQTTVADLAKSPDYSSDGIVEVCGFFLYRGTDEQAWLAVDGRNTSAVVALDSPEGIRDALSPTVPVFGGSEFVYAYEAKVRGFLSSGPDGMRLSEIESVELWEDGFVFHTTFG